MNSTDKKGQEKVEDAIKKTSQKKRIEGTLLSKEALANRRAARSMIEKKKTVILRKERAEVDPPKFPLPRAQDDSPQRPETTKFAPPGVQDDSPQRPETTKFAPPGAQDDYPQQFMVPETPEYPSPRVQNVSPSPKFALPGAQNDSPLRFMVQETPEKFIYYIEETPSRNSKRNTVVLVPETSSSSGQSTLTGTPKKIPETPQTNERNVQKETETEVFEESDENLTRMEKLFGRLAQDVSDTILKKATKV